MTKLYTVKRISDGKYVKRTAVRNVDMIFTRNLESIFVPEKLLARTWSRERDAKNLFFYLIRHKTYQEERKLREQGLPWKEVNEKTNKLHKKLESENLYELEEIII